MSMIVRGKDSDHAKLVYYISHSVFTPLSTFSVSARRKTQTRGRGRRP
jgi:hypothetical protein